MTIPAEDITPDIVAGSAAGRRPTLTLDVALYDRYLDNSGLAEDDRRALLGDLWAIIVGFVDLGFAVEPAVACAEESSGRGEELASSRDSLLDSTTNSTTDHFEKAATPIASSGD